MKRVVTFALCLAILMGLMAACASKPAPTTAATTAAPAPTVGETTAPPEPVTLTVGVIPSSRVQDYDTNAYTQWLREVTGYDIQIQLLPSDYKAGLAVELVENQQLPDVIWNCDLGDEAYFEYGSVGYLLDLTPYFEDKEASAIFWERMSLLPEDYQDVLVRRMTSENGRIYVMPTAEGPGADGYDFHPYINCDWLEKLGLSMPTTPEQLYDVLVAFRDQDPNGNGRKDEVPLIGCSNSLSGDLVNWIVNMFIYCDDRRWFNVDDNGQLYLPFVEDKYREALIYLHRLKKEGLLKSWNNSTTAMKGALCPAEGEPITVGAFVGHTTLCLTTGDPVIENYGAIPYFGSVVRNEPINSRRTFIPASTEHPDEAFRLLMVMCSRDSALRMRYGEYGVDWILPAENDNDGQIAAAVFGDPLTNDNNSIWGSVTATFMLYNVDSGSRKATERDIYAHEHGGLLPEEETQPGTEDTGKKVYNRNLSVSFDKAEAENNPKNRMPLLIYSRQQKATYRTEREACQTFIQECRASFIDGTGDFNDPSDDVQWKAYLAKLESLGLALWQTHTQEMCADLLK